MYIVTQICLANMQSLNHQYVNTTPTSDDNNNEGLVQSL